MYKHALNINITFNVRSNIQGVFVNTEILHIKNLNDKKHLLALLLIHFA